MKLSKNEFCLLATSTLLSLVFLLSGCVASKKDQFMEDMMAKGIDPLTSTELTKLYSDVTTSSKMKDREYEGKYYADGTRTGRAWGSNWEDSDKGEWRVTDDGLVCGKWLGKWSKSGERCWSVYPATSENTYTGVQQSGSKSKGNPDGISTFTVTPGT